MRTKLRKRLIRTLWILPLSLVLLVVIAVAILYFQQQRLVNLALKELNKQLSGELVIQNSNISAFENFPYISIRLNNVQFYPGKQQTAKPLYEAERMYVGFSLSDILKQQYHVKVIALRNGHLDLVQDQAGKLNIVEASRIKRDTTQETDTTTAPLDLDLKKIVFRNMKVTYLDQQSQQQVSANIEKIQSSLKADSVNITANLKGNMIVDYLRPGDTTRFRNKHLEADINLTYDQVQQSITLPLAKLKLEEALFNITGTADLNDGNLVDLKITGDKPDFGQLFSFAPDDVKKELKHFNYNGRLSFNGSVKGKLAGGQMPFIELNFACAEAWLHNTDANKKLDSLAFKGYYTNGTDRSLKTSELRLLNMNARPGAGVFRGNFVMRDFTNPKILMQVNANLELAFIGAFLGIKDLERVTGQVILKMDFKELVDISVPEKSMEKLSTGVQSELAVRNLAFRIPGYPYMVERLNLHAAMKSGFLNMDSLSFKVGNSDFFFNGSLSDLPALFHHQEKAVLLTLNAHSNKIIMKELLASDTARSNNAKEEIYNFNIGLAFATSVNELREPKPLPKGQFTIRELRAAFKNYPHKFHDFGAELTINDTMARLKNFAGLIDSSDIQFSGRVTNYALWFDKVKRGKTQIAFDLKSKHLAMKDVLGRRSRQHVPADYHDETATNLWLRSKTDLRYDSIFRFANIKIANISGELKKHAFRLDSISGNLKFGADHFVKIDTLKGKIGRSDFDISMRLYTGKDSARKAKENYLQFTSRFLDVDQLVSYRATFTEEEAPALSELPANQTNIQAVSKPSVHAGAFNIFKIPFLNFRADINIGRIKG
ncbi:MAG: AsmA family protein, partial [Niastella sp.]|nr:AsmA family protein [Niastella sp.]